MRKVNPTRIELLNLKKELKTAKRGHKLLKDKRDGLIKKFIETVKQARDLRNSVEGNLAEAFNSYERAAAMTYPKDMSVALMASGADIEIGVSIKSVMSVKVPVFDVKKSGTAFSYGFLDTTGDLDNAIIKFDNLFLSILKLAELEKTAENLAHEIEVTRRRVSALENIMIPELEKQIKFITMQLEERARSAVIISMKVKSMIAEKEGA